MSSSNGNLKYNFTFNCPEEAFLHLFSINAIDIDHTDNFFSQSAFFSFILGSQRTLTELLIKKIYEMKKHIAERKISFWMHIKNEVKLNQQKVSVQIFLLFHKTKMQMET